MSFDKKTHSLLGVISLTLSLLSVVSFIAGITLLVDGDTPEKIVLVTVTFSILAQPTALLLGVIGLLQKKSEKGFALAGTLISAVFSLFIFFFLMKLLDGFRIPGI